MIRIFVGAAPNGADAESQAVLEWTLRKHASEDIDITWMILSRDMNSPFYSNQSNGEGWDTRLWPTPFSGFRWAVPHLCGFEGKAIYLDSDMIALDDIAKLWNKNIIPSCAVLARSAARFCVSLWDCARAKHLVMPIDKLRRQDGHKLMSAHMRSNASLVQCFGDDLWNCLDGEECDLDDPKVKIIHYTSMAHQPHLKRAQARLADRGSRHWFDGVPTAHWRPDLQEMFNRLLDEAEANGCPVSNYDPGDTFGPLQKGTVAGLKGQIPDWGRGASI